MPDQPSKPQPSNAAAAATPIANIDDLLERAEDRLIPRGSTVRVSPDNPEIQTPAQLDEVQDTLTACGIKLVKDPALGKTDIKVDPPAKK
ncbi:MAG TPA: hypothetical protein VMS45_04015 [Gemmatimonadaceae bacterium]|nr:hypothetical protein [Gemmatimonadaceae bacterium]